ncbi:ribosome maturation factor RimP [Planosporangium thailandense]|uniref:Ribosome maturation factor RimP n=1 Tax=Planosporangium thailandense TaxID=765197 RepID=A0ABX0XQZ6_9ACTN|nr:ribosome maturation factor RimP [Planosporangium thailandense]NJC68246.1 ribosome maturation factor RimP [Planosporangium thailandense]
MPQQRRRHAGERAGARPPRQPAVATDLAGQRSRVRSVVEPVVSAAGYDLEALSLKRVGRRHQVRVIVDSDEGVNLDAVAELSRDISAALDEAEESGGDLVPGEYELEVSSPGIDRPLTLPRHWRRNVGRLVKVTVADRSVVGRVKAAADDGVEFEIDDELRRLTYEELGPGRVQIEFNRITELSDDELDEIDDEEGGDEE